MIRSFTLILLLATLALTGFPAGLEAEEGPVPAGTMWDRATWVPHADFVVGNPHWRWPNPGGTNPSPGTDVTVTYSLSGLADLGLPCDQVRAAVEEALGLWAAVAPLHFVEVRDSGPCPSSNDPNYDATGLPQLRFGSHTEDGPRGMLAHAYFPFSPSPNGLAGDVHFDCEENWSIGAGSGVFDFLEVCLHEIGHAIGLGHEPTPPGGNSAIMNPFYGGRFTGLGTGFLLQDDINGVQAIYGVGDTTSGWRMWTLF